MKQYCKSKNRYYTCRFFSNIALTVLLSMTGLFMNCRANQDVNMNKPNTTTGKAYKVLFSVDDKTSKDGTLTAMEGSKTISSPATVEEGKTVSFTAEPEKGYTVDTWTVSGSSFEEGTGKPGSRTAKVRVKNDAIAVMVSFKAQYQQVAYDQLEEYLENKALENEVNYITLTGPIPADDFKGDMSGQPGALGKKIKKDPTKKVALQLPETVSGLEDMSACFYGCENLISLLNVPKGVTNLSNSFYECKNLEAAPLLPESIINMDSCFRECSSLKEAPAIPSQVTNMELCFSNCTGLIKAPAELSISAQNLQSCFLGCSNLTEGPVIPSTVTNLFACFDSCTSLKSVTLKCQYQRDFDLAFIDCTALGDGSIKVPANQLEAYKKGADNMKAQASWFVAE